MNWVQQFQMATSALCIAAAFLNLWRMKQYMKLRADLHKRLRPIGKVIAVESDHIQLGVWEGVPPIGTVLFAMDPPEEKPTTQEV